MYCKLLTTFDRNNNVERDADLGEKIGNIGLGLLRIGCGKIVTVEKIQKDSNTILAKINSNDSDKTVFTDVVYSTSIRVVAVALFILAFPLTIPLTCMGCVGIAFSKSHQEIFSSYIQTALQVRKIPPIGKFDTFIGSPSGIKSVHGSGELFSDSEIVEKLPIIQRRKLGSGIYSFYTKHGKAIIQQQGTRGCTAATAAMLIMDNEKQPDVTALTTRNLGTDEDQKIDVEKAGLKVVSGNANTLSELRTSIILNNSCIVSIQGKLGAHVVIVDEVSRDLSQIRLRDPYHGWEITVSSDAFLKEWKGGKTMHIAKC